MKVFGSQTVMMLRDWKTAAGFSFKTGKRYFAKKRGGNFELTHDVSKERCVFTSSEVAI